MIEADILRSTILEQKLCSNEKHWEDQAHALQLTRLRLEQKLKQAKQEPDQCAQPLKGRKILVCIRLGTKRTSRVAVYSKSLIRCLHEAGAEVWLLTEYFDKLSEKGLRNLPKITKN